MDTQIINHAAQARCAECGSVEIKGVCHHCGKALCYKHLYEARNLQGASIEFADLDLENTACGEIPIHCYDCNHMITPPRTTWRNGGILLCVAGAIVLFLGVLSNSFVTQSSLYPIGVICVILGGGAIAFWRWQIQRMVGQVQNSRPSVPLLPYTSPVKVEEVVASKISLDQNGKYHIDILPTGGQLQLKMQFGSVELDRLEQYRRKYKLEVDPELLFQAGYLALKGPADVEFAESTMDKTRIIPFKWAVAAHPYLMNQSNNGECVFKYQYQTPTRLDAKTFPVRLVPSLAQESARRGLFLELTWLGPEDLPGQLRIHRIENLTLVVPATWGAVEQVVNATIENRNVNGDSLHAISWQKRLVRPNELSERRILFYIGFEKEIETRQAIQGQAEIIFQGTPSNVQGAALFYPTGRERPSPASEIETRLSIQFDLRLDGLRYQDVCVMPARKDSTLQKQVGSRAFSGVAPNFSTIRTLLTALSQQGFYIMRVIENPARTGARVDEMNCYWDIAGRKYDGIYPIDFHLVLSGQQNIGVDSALVPNQTRVEMSLQGVYANPEMQQQIESVSEQLDTVIMTAFAV